MLPKHSPSTGADELMLTTTEYDGPARIRTLRAVSDAARLADPPTV